MATTYATSPMEWRSRLRVSFSAGDVHGRVPVTDRILFLRKALSCRKDILRSTSRMALAKRNAANLRRFRSFHFVIEGGLAVPNEEAR